MSPALSRVLAGGVGGLALAALACALSPVLPTATPAPTPTPADPTAAYRRWPVIVRDDFAAPANGWDLAENSDDRWAKGRLAIEDGRYVFDLTANSGFVWWSRAAPDTISADFYAAVDARQVSGTGDADYGLLFHYQAGNYYFYSVSEPGRFAAYRYYREKWEAVQEWTDTPAFQPGATNRLAVAGEGDHYQLFLNNVAVGAFTDDVLPQGEAGLAVEIYTIGDSARFEFDNFEWRAPRGAVSVPSPTP